MQLGGLNIRVYLAQLYGNFIIIRTIDLIDFDFNSMRIHRQIIQELRLLIESNSAHGARRRLFNDVLHLYHA